MKFAICSLLTLLTAASALGARDAINDQLDTVDVSNLPEGAMLNVAELKAVGDPLARRGFCPINTHPKYCPAFDTCCPQGTTGCCPRACCRLPGGFCGSDGLCYITNLN